MNKKKLIYGTIVVVGILALYSIFKKKNPIALVIGGGDTTPFDPNEDYSKYVSSSFDPIAEAKKDSNFLAKVILLQKKLNKVLASKYSDMKQIEVDGYIGNETLRAIVRVFGDRFLPLTSKSQVEYLNNQLN